MRSTDSKKIVLKIYRLLSFWLVATLVFFLAFIIAEAGHDCSGDHCPICAGVERCERALGRLGMGGAAAAALVVGFGWEVLPAVRPAGRAPAGQTLVAVKVRLDD